MPNYSGIWSLSQQFQGRGQGLWPALPGAPTIGTATAATVTSASVAFTAPACAGVPATITGYTATSTPGCITGTGSSSPITVSGLTTGTAYTFKVKAQNATGFGACSAASNSVTPNAVTGQDAYTAAGTYTWIKPSGVTSVSIVAVGGGGSGRRNYLTGQVGVCWCGFGGGGGGGGGLAYLNNYDVSARSSLQLIVGAGGSGSANPGVGSVVRTCTGANIFAVCGGLGAGSNFGGSGGNFSGSYTAGFAGGGGGQGGYTPCGSNTCGGGGGGGAGYAGAGGAGGLGTFTPGTGGSAAGGSTNQGAGGVGILGQGASGTSSGGGGSGGANSCGRYGGAYGGGGGGGSTSTGGGTGAIRIIYPGTTRSFPSTNTGNL